MQEAAVQLCAGREEYLRQLLGGVQELSREFLFVPLRFRIFHGWDKQRPLAEVLEEERHLDREAGFTRNGPHRLDLIPCNLQGDPSPQFSRGQQKMLALTLNMAQAQVFLNKTGEKPVFLIDDLASELDSRRLHGCWPGWSKRKPKSLSAQHIGNRCLSRAGGTLQRSTWNKEPCARSSSKSGRRGRNRRRRSAGRAGIWEHKGTMTTLHTEFYDALLIPSSTEQFVTKTDLSAGFAALKAELAALEIRLTWRFISLDALIIAALSAAAAILAFVLC